MAGTSNVFLDQFFEAKLRIIENMEVSARQSVFCGADKQVLVMYAIDPPLRKITVELAERQVLCQARMGQNLFTDLTEEIDPFEAAVGTLLRDRFDNLAWRVGYNTNIICSSILLINW